MQNMARGASLAACMRHALHIHMYDEKSHSSHSSHERYSVRLVKRTCFDGHLYGPVCLTAFRATCRPTETTRRTAPRAPAASRAPADWPTPDAPRGAAPGVRPGIGRRGRARAKISGASASLRRAMMPSVVAPSVLLLRPPACTAAPSEVAGAEASAQVVAYAQRPVRRRKFLVVGDSDSSGFGASGRGSFLSYLDKRAHNADASWAAALARRLQAKACPRYCYCWSLVLTGFDLRRAFATVAGLGTGYRKLVLAL